MLGSWNASSLMGGSLLGFRHPQFSEDVDWLPAWIQQHHVEPFDEHIKEAKTALETRFKNISFGKDVNLSSRDEGRYKSCHLFLSGEDNSPASLAPSSGNVVHFHLHLSLDSTSQNMPSPLVDTAQAGGIASSNVVSVQQTEFSAGQQEMENQFGMDYNVGVVNFPPLISQKETSDFICPHSLAKDKDIKTKHEENVGYLKFSDVNEAVELSTSYYICSQSLAKDNDIKVKHEENVGYLKACDINEAVELSIAASEALVIHDIVKSSASTKSLAAAAVLEVALRVKQARLEGLQDNCYSLTEDVDEIGFLSDLDEFNISDAFEDVGFSVSGPDDLRACASAISQVKDTPNSENPYGCDGKYKYEGHGAPKVDCDDISTKQQLRDILDMAKQEGKDFPAEVLDFDRQRKLIDGPTFVLNTSVAASHTDSMLRRTVLANSDVPAATEGVNYAMENMTYFQPQINANCSPPAWSHVNEADDKLKIVGHDKFQSRWLGGWMWKKEINASTLVEHNNPKIIPELLVGETSNLSESADIAPDENSFVQNHDKGSYMASQSSIPFEGLHDRDDEDISFSQDVRCSSLSLLDPLCSVVPCSISSENACSTVAQNPNDEVDPGKCIRPPSEHCDMNLQRTSGLNAEFVHEERQAVSTLNGERSQSTVRRQLTSLRTYSMLLPHCSAFVERDSIYCNRSFPSEYSSELLSAGQNMGCIRGSTGLPSLKSINKCSTAREIKENHQTVLVQNPISFLMNQKRTYDETAKNGTEMQVHMEKDNCSPLILNWGRRCCFQASKEFVHDVSGDEYPEQSVVLMNDVELSRSKKLQKEQFNCKVVSDPEVPAKKRVRFSETEIQFLQKKNLQKLQSSYKDCSNMRVGKRLRHSNPKFKSKAREVKKRQTNCLDKDRIFQDREFLLTGFSRQKEKEIEGIIRKYGGIVLSDIPSPNSRGKKSSKLKLQQLPILLSFKKLETSKFLYGCAVNAYILKVNWLTDSVLAGYALPPNEYMIISNHVGEECTRIGRPLCRNTHNYIFDRVGIMLQGKHSFCTRLAKIVKHGGGQWFKTLQRLVRNLDAETISVGVIVAEDESRVSRHLKYCASEGKIPMMPASWIINSLHVGKLLPFLESKHSSPLPTIKILNFSAAMALSEEI